MKSYLMHFSPFEFFLEKFFPLCASQPRGNEMRHFPGVSGMKSRTFLRDEFTEHRGSPYGRRG